MSDPISVRLPAELATALRQVADRRGVTVSDLIRAGCTSDCRDPDHRVGVRALQHDVAAGCVQPAIEHVVWL